MLKKLACAAFIAVSALGDPAVAQSDSVPGVQNVAPGVRVINGAEVPSAGVDTAALEAMIKEKHSFRAAKDVLGNNGVDAPGPGGTTTYIYKVHDTVSAKNFVLILFVKGDTIVDDLLEEAAH